MGYDLTTLPSSEDALANVIRTHADREEQANGIMWAKWDLFDAYIAGFRRFDAFDAAGGRVASFFLDKDGRWQTQLGELLIQINRVEGALRNMDMRPMVERGDASLGALRDRAVAQIIGEAIVSEDQLTTQIKPDFFHIYVTLGTCGVQGHIVDLPTAAGLCADIEVVHPRELLPFPHITRNKTLLRGVIRQRTLTLEKLVSLYGNKVRANIRKLDARRRRIGDPLDDVFPPTTIVNASQAPLVASSYSDAREDENQILVKVRELWVHGPRNTVSRYVCSSRSYIFEDIDYAGRKQDVYCSLGIGRFLETGGFYGAGYADVLFSIIREAELLISNLLNTVRDLDKYPITLIPHGMVHERRYFKEDGGSGARFAMFDPEFKYAQAGALVRPITIAPHSAGSDLPGKTAAYMQQLIDRHALLRDITQDKGRVDSLRGLQFLDEKNAEPLTIPVSNAVNAFSDAYRYCVAEACSKLFESPRPLPVTRLDLDLIGAVIDFEKGTISFANNPLPDVSRLQFKARATSLQSPSLRKQEALEYVDKMLMDADGFKLFMLKEGLDPAMWIDEEKAAFETVKQNILMLFNDGKTPVEYGSVWIAPHTERADIQLRVLDSFMTGPTLRLASPAVINSFIQYRASLLALIGKAIPENVPDPTDIAQLQAQPQPGTLPGAMQQSAMRGRAQQGQPRLAS